MKKTILILPAALLTCQLYAQVNLPKSVVYNSDMSQVMHQPLTSDRFVDPGKTILSSHGPAHRTTSGSGGSRWYDYLDGIVKNYPTVIAVGASGLDLWNDTSSVWGYTGTTSPYSGNEFVSVGLGLHPFASAWNSSPFTSTDIAVTAADAYVIDSVQVLGWYNHNYSTPAKIAVVDTLIFSFVQGNGSTGDLIGTPNTSTHYGTINYAALKQDSLNNRAATASGGTLPVTGTPAGPVYKFLLTSSDTNNSNSTNNTVFPRPSHVPADPAISYSVTAGNFTAMTVSFKSGDASYPVFPGSDTTRYSDGTTVMGYKYGCYRQEIGYAAVSSSSGAAADWEPYTAGDMTSGYWKLEGVRDAGYPGLYIPNWPWHTGTSASPGPASLQYPFILFHVTCATCGHVGDGSLNVVGNTSHAVSVKAYPNPANDELTIAYSLPQNTNISVSLTNILGQVVATQKSENVANGNAVFNTSALAEGIYHYTFKTDNGAVTTGRVVITH